MRISANMCTKLPDNPLEERLRWVLPITRKEVRLKDVARVFPGGRRTLERWVADYKFNGANGLMPKSTRPLSQPNEVMCTHIWRFSSKA